MPGQPPEDRTTRLDVGRHGHPLSLVDDVVVPVEGTDREFFAQQWAVEFAAALGVRLRAIHVRSARDPRRQDLFAFLAAECQRWGVPFESRIIDGQDAATELEAELGPRDLVVIGSRRLSGRPRPESVAGTLVARAPCPVLIVRLTD